MVVVKTVLKSSGKYKAEHVYRIQRHLREYVKIPYKFVCYSDIEFQMQGEIRPLKQFWPGYWSKIEMFRDVEESFYIDLDMTISGDISDIVARKSRFCALRNMNPRIPGIGSALMKWAGDHRYIYDNFMANPREHMEKNSFLGTAYLGDQGFIYRQVEGIELFQDLFPRRIQRFDQKNGADITVYYGKWKPWK